MNISKDKVAHIDYTLTNDKGDVLDSSAGREPLAYLHGHGGLIPGLEKELEGKTSGDKFVAIVPPEEAYGIRSEEFVHEVPMDNFQDAKDVQVGAQFQVNMDGQTHIATVTQIEEQTVTVDLNHPLADETLHFDVEVTEVRDATKEELTHGHVHGPEGHHH